MLGKKKNLSHAYSQAFFLPLTTYEVQVCATSEGRGGLAEIVENFSLFVPAHFHPRVSLFVKNYYSTNGPQRARESSFFCVEETKESHSWEAQHTYVRAHGERNRRKRNSFHQKRDGMDVSLGRSSG